MALAPQAASTVELADQALAAQETADQAFAGLADLEIQGAFKGNDMAGINDVSAINIDGIDSAKGIEQHVALTGQTDPKHTFAAEKRLAKSLPRGIDGDAGSRGQPRGSLHDQVARDQRVVHNIAQKVGRDPDPRASLRRGEMVEKHVLTRDHALDRLEKAPATLFLGRGLDDKGRIHANHGTNLSSQGLIRPQGNAGDTGSRLAGKGNVHVFYFPKMQG